MTPSLHKAPGAFADLSSSAGHRELLCSSTCLEMGSIWLSRAFEWFGSPPKSLKRTSHLWYCLNGSRPRYPAKRQGPRLRGAEPARVPAAWLQEMLPFQSNEFIFGPFWFNFSKPFCQTVICTNKDLLKDLLADAEYFLLHFPLFQYC